MRGTTHKTLRKGQRVFDAHGWDSMRSVGQGPPQDRGSLRFVSGEMIVIVRYVYKINSSYTFPSPPGRVSAPLTALREPQAARSPS